MAARRGIGAAFAQSASNIGSLINEMLREQFQEESQRRQNADIEARQAALANLEHQNRLDELQATRTQAEKQAKDTDFGGMGKEVDTATNLSALPTATSIIARGRQDDQTDPYFAGPIPQIRLPNGTMQEVAAHPIRPTSERTPIEDLISQQEAKRTQLLDQRRIADNAKVRVDPTQFGLGGKGFIDANGQPVQTELNANESAAQDALKTIALNAPDVARAQGSAFNTISGMERGAKAADAFSTNFATTNAQQQALDSPDNVAGAARRAGAIAGAEAPFKQTNTSANSAAASIVPMTQSAAMMDQLEKQGAGVGWEANQAATSIGANSVLGSIKSGTHGMIGPRDMDIQYANAAHAWAGFALRALSGQQASQQEADRVFGTYVALTGDSDSVRKQKSAQRAVFNMAIQAQARGASGQQVGQIIGKAIKDGTIPQSALDVQYSPEISDGIFSVLGRTR